jgi:hypothetical protein
MKHRTFIWILPLLALLGGCESIGSSGESFSGSDTGTSGQGGSMARFALAGDYLYIVDQSRLKTFDVSTAGAPKYLDGKDQYMDFGVETIFPMDTLLFIGSENGMYIYDITKPELPQQLAYVLHIRSCDPVVASGQYAYVTLNSESACGSSIDELHVYDISDIRSPRLIHSEQATRHPKGLGIDGNRLFVCDAGLKVYDVTDPARPVLTEKISDIPGSSGAETYDVIPLGGLLLLIADNGLYQYDYTGGKLSLVSKIEISKE